MPCHVITRWFHHSLGSGPWYYPFAMAIVLEVCTLSCTLVMCWPKQGHYHRVPSVHGTCYPVLAWSIQLLAYAMPSVPVPPMITLLTDMVPRCRLLAAHGLRSCLSVRTQPLTATGAPSQTSTMPCHAMPCTHWCAFTDLCHAMPCHAWGRVPNLPGGWFISDDPLHGGVRGS